MDTKVPACRPQRVSLRVSPQLPRTSSIGGTGAGMLRFSFPMTLLILFLSSFVATGTSASIGASRDASNAIAQTSHTIHRRTNRGAIQHFTFSDLDVTELELEFFDIAPRRHYVLTIFADTQINRVVAHTYDPRDVYRLYEHTWLQGVPQGTGEVRGDGATVTFSTLFDGVGTYNVVFEAPGASGTVTVLDEGPRPNHP